MQAIEKQIIELTNKGLKPKAITESVKKAGTLTAKGKIPTYAYIQSKLQALRAKGVFKRVQSNYSHQITKEVNTTNDPNNMVQTILNDTNLSDSKKIALLQTWFA